MCPMALTALAVVGSLAGGVVQAMGAQQAADAEAEAEERRAQLAERAKEVNQVQASFDSKRTKQHLMRIHGNNRAAGAERGLAEGGSLTDVIDDNSYEAAQDLEARRFAAEGERDNLTMEAADARARADSARKAGGIAAFGSILGGVTSAFSTLGNAYYRRQSKIG
jgi:type II secretory pathway pseudopilin PulG